MRWTIRSVAVITAPLGVQLLLTPFWMMQPDQATWLPPLQIALTGLFFPAYLAGVGVWYIAGAASRTWMSIVGAALSVFLLLLTGRYLLWGVSGGQLLGPDSATLAIVRAEAISGTLIIMVVLGIALAVQAVRSKPHIT
ncbi:MAG: hypothetical protein ACK56C_12835 [Alphaproteobacteria bacterium]